jgi:hypothetical protein
MRSSSSNRSVADRYFTPDEVEALIPQLTALVERLRTAHAVGQTVRERLEAEKQRLTLAGGAMLDQSKWRADSARLEAATREAQAVIEELGALGGVPKDIGMGLVDFPHLRDGRVVNLCWKHGETHVRWWHGLDEGFAARKPL